MFTNATSLKEIENLTKKLALMLLHKNYLLSYEELLDKPSRSTLNVKGFCFSSVEVHETINNVNPRFLKQFLELMQAKKNARQKYRLNLNILNYNQV